MKKLFSQYAFPESWAELNPRFAFADSEINLNIQFFTELDWERAQVVDSDCTPMQIQTFMVKVSVALSYATVMAARLGGHLNQARERMDNVTAARTSALSPSAKSDAALARQLTLDPDLIKAKWEVADLEVMHKYSEDVFRTLQKDAENWRARFYGAHSDRKLTPSVNEPYTGGDVDVEAGILPPRIGGRS